MRSTPTRTRRHVPFWIAALVAACVSVLAPAAPASAASYPNSMDGLGDSITRAFNTCRIAWVDCPQNSWSTGTNSDVNSHYLRILANNPQIEGKNYNDAVSGAKAADVVQQADKAISRGAEYVTIEIGANDACTSSESTMTSVSSYQSSVSSFLGKLGTQLPDSKVFVASVPDVYHLWELFHTDPDAVATWDRFDICQSLLANATSTATEDSERRQRVRQRVIDFNNVLQNECARHANCKFDDFAGFDYKFAESDVSTRDYFHPSVSGQATIARVTWAATWTF
jgi:GDSL-like Lipase/Acylhydrolase.